jgi:nitrogen fixation/metabolism regulation signal transduction histidine kinase
MDDGPVRPVRGALVLAGLLAAGLAGLALLTQTVQNSDVFGRWHQPVLVANALGALLLLALLGVNVARLLRARRQHVPGAALKLRMVGAFAALAAGPVLIVFIVSLQFLHRGIESWADDRIAQGLERSLQLSRAALDEELRADLGKTRGVADRLEGLASGGETALAEALPGLQRATGAWEMSIFGRNYRIVATSSSGLVGGMPELPTDEVLLQLGREGRYVAVEPRGAEALRIRAAVTFDAGPARPGDIFVLQALYPVGDQLGALAESVQATYTRYGELVFLREPLESSFTLALTVALLLSLFTAFYGALLFARKLVAPIRNLVAGTRAVARGDLATRLPVTSRDDIGALVDSFNDMTARLEAAGAEARRSAAEIERSRASLAAVLGGLTSGVIAVDSRRRLRIANEAAGAVLHADLGAAGGEDVDAVAARHPHVGRFFEACEARTRQAPDGWREQVPLVVEGAGRRVLMCSAAPLPDEQGTSSGYVLVFDDITAMLQAQREAAWGEVARRLAHEIKNPLTPIQLSAERIRRRYLASLPGADAELLDRATHTIVQQVAAMRDMVNAFSEYARAPEVAFAPLDLNGLVREVADLYHGPQQPELRLELDPALGPVEADAVRLRQLLHNLIRNAGEALEGRTDGVVTVATGRAGEDAEPAVEIRVEDNGPGIDPELLERIFDPYVTSKTRGTGLGLAIVRRLVEEHGGAVAAANRAGGGARVTVTLPVLQRGREAAGDTRPRRAGERR